MRRHYENVDTAQQTWLRKQFGKERTKLLRLTHALQSLATHPWWLGLHEYDGVDLKICQVFFRSFLLVSETSFLEESLRNERLALTDVIL